MLLKIINTGMSNITPVMTPEKFKDILALVRGGMKVRHAATFCRASKSSFYNYCNEDKSRKTRLVKARQWQRMTDAERKAALQRLALSKAEQSLAGLEPDELHWKASDVLKAAGIGAPDTNISIDQSTNIDARRIEFHVVPAPIHDAKAKVEKIAQEMKRNAGDGE